MASSMSAPSLYPSPSPAALKLHHVGKPLSEVQAPAAILDRAVVRRNCNLMLNAARELGVGFRAHVKTHKTTEVAKLQVGDSPRSIKLIASTVSEIEHLTPWLLESQAAGSEVNLIYGLPISPSHLPRLSSIARLLGPNCLCLFADHPSHIAALNAVPATSWPGRIPVWINIDVGDHREGIAASSPQLAAIARAVRDSARVRLAGVYTHFGSSYGSSGAEAALENLSRELEGVREGTEAFLEAAGWGGAGAGGGERVTLSVGASPTATAAQNLLEGSAAGGKYREVLRRMGEKFEVELHAGVYPVMDMQQLATRARPRVSPTGEGGSLLSYADLGFRVLCEVASLYPDRGEKPEALIASGSIVLGREPCKSYPGWGVVTPWPRKLGEGGAAHYDPEGSKTGWIVGRVSQEHGVLTWEGDRAAKRELSLGEKVMVWPNHACIAGVNFGWFVVVDSESDDPDMVRDVWMRWRGW